MRTKRICFLALLSMGWLTSLTGRAALAGTPPSRWDRAKDPAKADAWDLHVSVSEAMAMARLSSTSESERDRLLEMRRDALEGAHAATSPYLFLRFDLGELYERIEHYGEAIQVLEPALALAPDDDPATERAWDALATAYAKTDDSHKEIHAYGKILALTVSMWERARVLANRAEAEMRLGHLDEAVEGYKDALAISESNTGSSSSFVDGVLAHWGLTVALDRLGDATGSEREAALTVTQHGLEVIRGDGVFFVPDYELFYYLGLGGMARAKQAASTRDAASAWSATEAAWMSYVSGAVNMEADCEKRHACADGATEAECERTKKLACPADRWLARAKAHLAHAHKERIRAEERAGIHVRPRLGAEIRVD
jgi:tetratricopeptide (TPR) repeat protein